MSNLEQIQKDFQELPEEAQTLLMDFIEILKKRYSQTIPPEPTAEKSPYQQFQESGLIDCGSVEENLATPEGIDRRAFMKLPMTERQRILATQAEAMATHYEQDTEWRDWVNLDLGVGDDQS